jgi:hypothetical protein
MKLAFYVDPPSVFKNVNVLLQKARHIEYFIFAERLSKGTKGQELCHKQNFYTPDSYAGYTQRLRDAR